MVSSINSLNYALDPFFNSENKSISYENRISGIDPIRTNLSIIIAAMCLLPKIYVVIISLNWEHLE